MIIRFVTKNDNKLKEVQSLLSEAKIIAVKLEIDEIQTDDVEKLLKDKLLKAFQSVGRPVFVEHTGLYIESLNGFPGGLTQEFWDKLKEDRFSKLLGSLENTNATARTTIGYCDGKKIHLFDGEVAGKIPPEPRGNTEFQWDCVFIPNGHEHTFSELGAKKNEISMRKIAFDKFNTFLKGGN